MKEREREGEREREREVERPRGEGAPPLCSAPSPLSLLLLTWSTAAPASFHSRGPSPMGRASPHPSPLCQASRQTVAPQAGQRRAGGRRPPASVHRPSPPAAAAWRARQGDPFRRAEGPPARQVDATREARADAAVREEKVMVATSGARRVPARTCGAPRAGAASAAARAREPAVAVRGRAKGAVRGARARWSMVDWFGVALLGRRCDVRERGGEVGRAGERARAPLAPHSRALFLLDWPRELAPALAPPPQTFLAFSPRERVLINLLL